jgi:BirA family biotin operon repressor/biotin-[acetyl-CoA-carboxylase] ligase
MTIPEDLADLCAAQSAGHAPFDIRWLASTTSTMDVASKLAHEGAGHGVVVVADEQTSGRGRRGTTWQSPAGAGLYFSFIARPRSVSSALPLITLAAGVAAREGIQRATGLAADLKWPNDVIAGTRKLAGILAEGVSIGSPEQAVIIGVGVNIQSAAYPPDVAARATSLEGELGRTIERGPLLAALLTAIDEQLAQVDKSPGDILQSWRAMSPNAEGTRVEWDGKQGVTAGIDDSGALLVRANGAVERIVAGELRWHLR